MVFDARRTLPIGLVLAGLLCTLVGAGDLLRSYGVPRVQLSVEPTSLDLARAKTRTSEVPVKLWVTNTGSDPVSVRHIGTSCDCTVAAPVDPTPLAPGERRILELTVQLPDHGKRQSVVSLVTEPPAEVPEIILNLSGRNVEAPFINRMPGPLQLEVAAYGVPITYSFAVETAEELGTSDIWLSGMETDDEDVHVALVDVEDVREEPVQGIVLRRYHFELTCSVPEGSARGRTFVLHPVKQSPAALTTKERPLPVRVAVTE